MLSTRMMRAVCEGVVRECANMYGFDANEALNNLSDKVCRKKEKKVKVSIPLPFLGRVESECCKGIAMNNGLYTQCKNKCMEICASCNKNAVDGVLPYGTISERIAAGNEYKDGKGRKPVPYAIVLETMKITREDAVTYASSIGLELPDSVFEMPAAPEKKEKKAASSGRPKKAGKSVVVDESEDLFAGLVQNSLSECVSVDDSAEKAAALAQEKAEKAEKLAQEKAEKADKLAQEKAEKAEKLAQEKAEKAEKLALEKAAKAEKLALEKAEKEAKLTAEKAEKEAKKLALEAEKKEKAEKLAQEKAEKAEKLAQEKAAKAEKLALEKAAKAAKSNKKTPKLEKKVEVEDTEDETEEEEVQVTKFEFGGKKYLRSSKNVLYDAETQDEIGVWNEAKQEIEFAELEEEEEEE